MNVATLEKEIELLPEHLQDRLAAFLTALRMHRSGQDHEIFNRLDDRSSENWQSWTRVKDEIAGNEMAEE